MRKLITTALAAVTLGGALLSTAAPASAAPFGGYHGGFHGGGHGFRGGGYGYRGGGGWGWGGAAVAGLAGLAIGSALASPGYYNYGPGPGYYGDSYYAPGPYATCYATNRVWDGYRWIFEREPYAC